MRLPGLKLVRVAAASGGNASAGTACHRLPAAVARHSFDGALLAAAPEPEGKLMLEREHRETTLYALCSLSPPGAQRTRTSGRSVRVCVRARACARGCTHRY